MSHKCLKIEQIDLNGNSFLLVQQIFKIEQIELKENFSVGPPDARTPHSGPGLPGPVSRGPPLLARQANPEGTQQTRGQPARHPAPR